MSTATTTEKTSTPPTTSTILVEGHDLLRYARMVRVDQLTAGRQALSDLPTDEYEVLKEDIAENEVLVPLEVDDQGNVLDGLHRLRACQELGVERVPIIIRHDLTEDQKRVHAFRLNILRRHLSRTLRDKLIRRLLAKGASTRQAAKEVGTSRSTVQRTKSTVPDETVDGAKAPSEDVTGADERVQRRTSPKREAAAKARRKPEATEELKGAPEPTAPPSPEATSAAPAPEQPGQGAPKAARGKSLAVEEILESTQATASVLARHKQAPPRRRDDVLGAVDVLRRECEDFLKRSGAKATSGG